MKYIENIKGTNQHKIGTEKGFIIIDADSKEQAIEKYNANYTPLHDKKRELLAKVKSDVSKRLQATDYKVIRHRDQQALKVDASLTELEYQALLEERQQYRTRSNQMETEIDSLTTIQELENYQVRF